MIADLVAFESLQGADDNDQLSRSPKNCQGFENEALAIACTRTEYAIIALKYPSYDMHLPFVGCVRELQGVDETT